MLFAIIGGALRVSTPFMFVALGECLTEKSGRVNLGLEGTLVLGAMSAYAISYHTGSPWLGVLAAGCAGAVLGGMHGYVCKLPQVNDIAIGIAMMLFGTGIAFFFGKAYIQPSAPRLGSFSLGGWTGNPQIETALQINPLLLVGVAVAHRDGLGLRQHPLGPDRAHDRRQRGVGARDGRVGRSGALPRHHASAAFSPASAARSCRSTIPARWNQGLSSGQGLMAVALVIFARWNPLRCVVAALLFGAAGAIGPALQSVGITQGYYFFNAAPYILTLIIMIGVGRLEAGAARRAGRAEHHQVRRPGGET